jgi:hypothetical protein
VSVAPLAVIVPMNEVRALPEDAELDSDFLKLLISVHMFVTFKHWAISAIRTPRELSANPW